MQRLLTRYRVCGPAWMVLLSLLLVAGCIDDQGKGAGIHVVLLSGTVHGDNGSPSEAESCDAVQTIHFDTTRQSVRYVEGLLEIPDDADTAVLLDGSFDHPRATPCWPFWGIQFPGSDRRAATLSVEPFHLEWAFDLEGDVVVVGEERLVVGQTVERLVDMDADGVHYTGTLHLSNLGLWSKDRFVAVDTVSEL